MRGWSCCRRDCGASGKVLALAADPGGWPTLAPALFAKARISGTLDQLPGLVRYLRRERPAGLVSGMTHLNLEAVWARRLAREPRRLVLTERVHLSTALSDASAWRRRYLPGLVGRTYPFADAVVAVSDGVADDLATLAGLPRGRVRTVYNPVVRPEIRRLAAEPAPHRWLSDGGPPVVLGAGRLTEQKDFPTLVSAFAKARRQRPLRLVILGEAQRADADRTARAELRGLAERLGVGAEVELPGFVANPYAWMARASLFALSSAWEGFGNVLVEAMACGCPVVSTDCPSGPAEILGGGRYGPLVPVRDPDALAAAMLRTLAAPPETAELAARADQFSVDHAADSYERLLGLA